MNNYSEKKIVYEFEMNNPKSSYIKPLYGKKSRKYVVAEQVLAFIIAVECVAIMCFDYGYSRYLWGIITLLIILNWVGRFLVMPYKRKKLYEKIHTQKEDCFSYIFYEDCVRIKNPTIEATLNYDTAEYYAEDDERLAIIFSFNRTITIDKKQCDEEKLIFFRKLVPEENQKKSEKKTSIKFAVRTLFVVLYAIVLAVLLGIFIHEDKNRYIPEYQCTTYESFETCLEQGTIKDVVIVKNKYVEYTYTGRMEEERYYTVCSDSITDLIQKMDNADVNWESE